MIYTLYFILFISKDDLYNGRKSHKVSLRSAKPFLRYLAKTLRGAILPPPPSPNRVKMSFWSEFLLYLWYEQLFSDDRAFLAHMSHILFGSKGQSPKQMVKKKCDYMNVFCPGIKK